MDRSAIQAAPFRVVEHGRSHLHGNVTAWHRHVKSLAHALATAADHRERDRALQNSAVVGRSNMTDGLKGGVRPAEGATCAPSSSTTCGSTVMRPTSCFRCVAIMAGRMQRALSHEVVLGLADRPTEPDVIRRNRAVGFLADDDVALLGAQHVHGFGAVRGDVVRLAGRRRWLPTRRVRSPRAH